MRLPSRASRAAVALLIALGLVGMHALVLPTMTRSAVTMADGHHAGQIPGMPHDMAAVVLTALDNGCESMHDHCLAVLRTPTPLAGPTDVALVPTLGSTAVLVVLHAAQASDRAPPPTPTLVEIGVSRT